MALASLFGCGGHPADGTASVSSSAALMCTAIDASVCAMPTPSYASDIAPLLDRECNDTCHAPGVGPWPLTSYSDVVAWAISIRSDVEGCKMPPPDAGSLEDVDRENVLNWLACGAPDN